MLGISPQDLDSHEKWATKRELPFVLLADTDKKVIELYGVKGPAFIAVKRSVFVVDQSGTLRFVDRKSLGATFVSFDKLAPILEEGR